MDRVFMRFYDLALILMVALVCAHAQENDLVVSQTLRLNTAKTGSEDSPSKAAVKTTLCRLATAPDEFNNKLISVRARAESDGMHKASLVDSSCPGKNASMDFDRSAEEESKYAFLRAFFSGAPGTYDKQVTGVFTGTFHWYTDQNPARVITVTKISHLKTKKRTNSNAAKQ